MYSNAYPDEQLTDLYYKRRDARDYGTPEEFASIDAQIKRIEADTRLLAADIPFRYAKFRFDGSPAPAALVARCRAWFESGAQGCYLWGPTGRCKTALAVAMLSTAIEDSVTGRFIAVPDTLARLREAAGGDESAVKFRRELRHELEGYRGDRVIVLDDLGVGAWSQWLEETVYGWVNSQYEEPEFRRLIVTSNLAPADLPDAIGDRAAWRVIEMAGEYVIKADGANQRAHPRTAKAVAS